jgi:hypothetical protein
MPMPRPEFTPYEEYLIASIKTVQSSAWAASYGLMYLLIGAALFIVGVYRSESAMMITGFGLVAVGRLYEEYWYRQQTPLWRSIIVKFESAFDRGVAADSNTTTLR